MTGPCLASIAAPSPPRDLSQRVYRTRGLAWTLGIVRGQRGRSFAFVYVSVYLVPAKPHGDQRRVKDPLCFHHMHIALPYAFHNTNVCDEIV